MIITLEAVARMVGIRPRPFVFFDNRVRRWFATNGNEFIGNLIGYDTVGDAVDIARWYAAEPS